MFTDRVVLKCVAGKGGNGLVSWRREKYIPKGGPNGGNGGKGGDIIFEAKENELSLESFRHRRHIKAPNGLIGGSNRRQGKCGKDLILSVPCGTLIKDGEGRILCDLTEPGMRWTFCRGGRGGRGNASFKSSTNQAPNFCTPGKEGEEREVELELKLIADVGLVGFPNAGKSTLISTATCAKVKIAPYPFTTLRPNLGYIEFDDFSRILLADIPGIIRGAHEDRGLGLEFLRHIERTQVLLYLIDASGIDGRDPLEDFAVLQQELFAHDPALKEKPFFVVLNKVDDPLSDENVGRFYEAYGQQYDVRCISAQEGTGIPELLAVLRDTVHGKPSYTALATTTS